MSDQDSGSNLVFADVRRMSEGQINRLSKNQLKSILKEAISEADNVPVPTVDAVRMKALISDAVSDIKRELLLESQKLITEVRNTAWRRK